MDSLVFTYGTLKQGFSNAAVNGGIRVGDRFRTVLRWPLYVAGPLLVPWLVEDAGQGHAVIGEVYRVDVPTLAQMDELERIDEPGWYARREIEVQALDGARDAPALRVQVYFGSAVRLRQWMVHAGPLAEYTLAQDRAFRGRLG